MRPRFRCSPRGNLDHSKKGNSSIREHNSLESSPCSFTTTRWLITIIHSLSATKPIIAQPITFGSTDTLKILLTTKEDGTAKRPHQAFLMLKEVDTGLETAFPLTVKETGKGKLDIVSQCVLSEVEIGSSWLPRHTRIYPSNSSSQPSHLMPTLWSHHLVRRSH